MRTVHLSSGGAARPYGKLYYSIASPLKPRCACHWPPTCGQAISAFARTGTGPTAHGVAQGLSSLAVS
eukprot:105695-Hanusia_phi.AAC.1